MMALSFCDVQTRLCELMVRIHVWAKVWQCFSVFDANAYLRSSDSSSGRSVCGSRLNCSILCPCRHTYVMISVCIWLPFSVFADKIGLLRSCILCSPFSLLLSLYTVRMLD